MLSGLVAVVRRRSAGGAAGSCSGWYGAAARLEPRRLSSTRFTPFVLVATLPVLLLAAVDSQLSAAKREADGGARLHEAVTALTQHIEEYVANHTHAVQIAGRGAVGPTARLRGPPAADRRSIRRSTRASSRSSPPIARGIVREIFPLARTAATPPITDRQYFIDAMQNRRMAVSDVILGRLSHVPIVTIAVPIVHADGDVAGVAGGSLDLSKFERFVGDFRTLADARHHGRSISTIA